MNRPRSLLLLAIALLAAGCSHTRNFACPRFTEFRIPVDGQHMPAATAQARTITPLASAMTPLASAMAGAIGRESSSSAPLPPGANERYPAPAIGRDILVLSGGGAWGAYGAGLLRGWSASAALPRPPAFGVVTGVSTGALQAPLAFLGSAQDPALIAAYTITREQELINQRSLVGVAVAGAFADTRPLERRVRALLAGLYPAIASEGARGRVLLVGVVDALDGKLYAVDLTKMARTLSGETRADCMSGALMASAAVPLEFDRVTVGGRPYFDGGVRRTAFVLNIQNAAAQAMTMNGPSRLYLLLNGDPAVERLTALKSGLLPTLKRLNTLVIDQTDVTSLEDGARAAPPGYETFIASAADHPCGPSDAGHNAVFDPAFMRCLIRYGESGWRDGKVPWTRYAAPQPAILTGRQP